MDYSWEFDSGNDLASWKIKRAEVQVSGGALNIRNASFPEFYSPEGLGIPTGMNVIHFRIKSNKGGIANLSFYSARTNYTYALSFRVFASEDYRNYRVYLGALVPPGDRIFDFAFKLPGNGLSASIDAISFYEPTTLGLASIYWDDFWELSPISVGSSNLINTPHYGSVSFMVICYILVPLFFILILIFFLLKKVRFTNEKLLRAALGAFFVVGILFALKADFNWLRVWSSDRALLSGKHGGERIRALNYGNYDSYFDFIDEMKRIIPKGEKARPAGRGVADYTDHVARSVSYNLLPVKSAPDARYLWLYLDETDRDIVFDPVEKSLKRRGVLLAKPVELVRSFGDDALLYKIIDVAGEEKP